MQAQTNVQAQKLTPSQLQALVEKKKAKLVTITKMKLEPGEGVEGILEGVKTETYLNRQTGEDQEYEVLTFTCPITKDQFQVNSDAGLKNSMKRAGAVIGDHLVIQKLDKIELETGHTCNQYQIWKI